MSGVPYIFGNATTSIPLSQLDVNFATNATLGNATVGLGNTTTTVGNLTLTSPVISGGTIDNAVIGGTTAVAGSFTTLGASGAVTLSGGTANGVAYLNGSKVLTTGSALTFDGSALYIGGSTSGAGVSIYQSNGNATGSPFSVAYSSSNNSGYEFMAMYYLNGVNQYQYYVDWSGTIHARSIVITSLSDQRLKTNIKDIKTGLAEINALQPRNFDWIDGSKTNVTGFIAQEFQQIFPNSVSNFKAGEDGIEYLAMNHEELIPSMVKAIQELSAQITNLEIRLKNANIA